MIADFEKYRWCMQNAGMTSVRRIIHDRRGFAWLPVRIVYFALWKYLRAVLDIRAIAGNNAGLDVDERGSWYHWGVKRACASLEKHGFRVIDADVELVPRDPIIHFSK